jgi:hypothetical protein
MSDKAEVNDKFIPKTDAMRIAVQTMIDSGYTYREIMEKVGLSSPSHVSYYAKDIHQHRLSVVDTRPGRKTWSCTHCHRHFKLVEGEPE